jgi:hypothetical protein
MLTAAWSNPAASGFALFGAICLVSWPLCRTRRGMLLLQIGIGIGYGLHYLLWGSATAATVNGLGAVQTAAALLFGGSPRLRWLVFAPIPALAGACALTWHGLPSVLALVGQTLTAFGRVQLDTRTMRVLVSCGTLFWLAHDTVIGSPVLIADLMSLTIGAFTILIPVLVTATPPHIAMRRPPNLGSNHPAIGDGP